VHIDTKTILLLLQNWYRSNSKTYLVVSYSGWFMYIFIALRGEPNTNTAYADSEVSNNLNNTG